MLLVLDAGTGQNALAQAKTFSEAAPLTGLVLTKLDGTAKVASPLPWPSRAVCRFSLLGWVSKDDLRPFEPRSCGRLARAEAP